jgi:hypothetical protein
LFISVVRARGTIDAVDAEAGNDNCIGFAATPSSFPNSSGLNRKTSCPTPCRACSNRSDSRITSTIGGSHAASIGKKYLSEGITKSAVETDKTDLCLK